MKYSYTIIGRTPGNINYTTYNGTFEAFEDTKNPPHSIGRTLVLAAFLQEFGVDPHEVFSEAIQEADFDENGGTITGCVDTGEFTFDVELTRIPDLPQSDRGSPPPGEIRMKDATTFRQNLAAKIAKARKSTACCNSDIWDQFHVEIRSLAQLTHQPTGLIVADLLDDADQIDDCENTPMGAAPIINPCPKGWDKIEGDSDELGTADYLRDLLERLRNVPAIHGMDGYDIERLDEIAKNLDEESEKLYRQGE